MLNVDFQIHLIHYEETLEAVSYTHLESELADAEALEQQEMDEFAENEKLGEYKLIYYPTTYDGGRKKGDMHGLYPYGRKYGDMYCSCLLYTSGTRFREYRFIPRRGASAN